MRTRMTFGPALTKQDPSAAADLIATAKSALAAQEITLLRNTFKQACHTCTDIKILDALAFIARDAQQYQTAQALLDSAITLSPNTGFLYAHRAIMHYYCEQYEAALADNQQAIVHGHPETECHINMGVIYNAKGELAKALEHYEKALARQPDNAKAYYNRGNALRKHEQTQQAIENFCLAHHYAPKDAMILNNLGLAHQHLNHIDMSIAVFKHALLLDDSLADAHFNLGLSYLLKGDFAAAWPEYEWRWRNPNNSLTKRHFKEPQWQGEPLNGQHILCHAEQGFGDTIQFVRYLPMIKALGGHIIVECRKDLHRLLQDLPEIDELVVTGAPLPKFAVHCGLLSLPHVLHTTLATIPNKSPYLVTPDRLMQIWQQRLQSYQGKKIAVVWAGSTTHKNDHNRSVILEQLRPLISSYADQINWFSLQKGPPAQQLGNSTLCQHLVDVGQDCEDFADTAACLSQMDLLISVDTGVAHLAGALNIPAWVMLPFDPDWRWMLDREDSPWYPSLRLFRQPQPGDWESVIKNIIAELALLP